MTDAAFLRAILDAPDDDAPRLVYADWLTEHGEEERAEFIRVQCALPGRQRQAVAEYRRRHYAGRDMPDVVARHIELAPCPVGPSPLGPNCDGCALADEYFGALRRRERELESVPLALWSEWCRPMTTLGPEVTWTCRRGFVEAVTCPAAAWLEHGDAVTAAQPVREVMLTTWPDAVWDLDGPYPHLDEEPSPRALRNFLGRLAPGVKFTLPPVATA